MARVSKKRNAYIRPQSSANISNKELYQTAIYARLSVEDNGKDSDSLEAQVQYLKSFLEDKPQMELRGIFTDNGFSGTNYERPEFQKMMDLVRAGKINCIIVKDLSRLGNLLCLYMLRCLYSCMQSVIEPDCDFFLPNQLSFPVR